jgi:hypothetical protein
LKKRFIACTKGCRCTSEKGRTSMTQSNPNMNQGPGYQKEYEVQGPQLVEKVKELIHEGNVRDVIIKRDGQAIIHFPLTVGVVGALIVPQLAALGAISALLTHCTIEVVRTDQP